jgi:hypothetical protein
MRPEIRVGCRGRTKKKWHSEELIENEHRTRNKLTTLDRHRARKRVPKKNVILSNARPPFSSAVVRRETARLFVVRNHNGSAKDMTWPKSAANNIC